MAFALAGEFVVQRLDLRHQFRARLPRKSGCPRLGAKGDISAPQVRPAQHFDLGLEGCEAGAPSCLLGGSPRHSQKPFADAGRGGLGGGHGGCPAVARRLFHWSRLRRGRGGGRGRGFFRQHFYLQLELAYPNALAVAQGGRLSDLAAIDHGARYAAEIGNEQVPVGLVDLGVCRGNRRILYEDLAGFRAADDAFSLG